MSDSTSSLETSARPRAPKSQSLAGDAAYLAIGSLLTQGLQLLSLSVLARYVAKANLATYQQLNLIYGIISPLLLGGVPAALLYFIPRSGSDEERRAWLFRAYLLLLAMGVAAGTAVAVLRGPIASGMNNDGLREALPVYAPYLLFAFISAATPPALVATGHAKGAAALNGALGVLTFGALITTAVIEPTGVALAAALSASAACLALVSVVLATRMIGLPRSAPSVLSETRTLLAYGLPLALAGLAGTIGFQFDRLVVSANFPPAEFAVYAVGAVEVPLGLLMAQAVTNVLLPELSRRWQADDLTGMVSLWREALRQSALVLVPLFVFLMVMAADAVRVLYGSGFGESVSVFRIYLFLIPFRVATWGLIPSAIGRTRIHAGASVILLAANAAIALALVGPLGFTGPALAAPVATALAATYYVIRIRRIVGIGFREILPVRALAGILVAAGVAALPLLLVEQSPLPAFASLAAGGAVFGLLTLGVLHLTRQLTPTDRGRLGQITRRIRGA